MPELPEVETVRNKLISLVIKKTIKSVDVYYSKHQLLSNLKNEKINDIKRLGKYLIFELDNYYMISHLRMEGKYFYKDKKDVTKHDLVCFNLDNDKYLFYNDVRKFGVFYLFNKNEDIYSIPPLSELGKEPFTITKEELYSKVKNIKNPIKESLLNQNIISGIGNIYADEILFDSKIHPLYPSNNISLDDCERLIDNSIKILNKSINDGGSTIRSFTSLAEAGHFQTSLKVHLRENERCYNCSSYIIKTRVSGRGTYYCPNCQRLDKKMIIGITGGFSSGKSTFTKIINKLGYYTLNLDLIYNDLFISNHSMQKEIFKEFKTLEKSKLKEIVFNNQERNNRLKDITHKYVMKEMYRLIDETKSNIIFVEVPLLFESKLEKAFDKIICVVRSINERINSSKQNGFNEDETKKRINSQINDEYKIEHSDFVVYNNTTIDDLYDKARKIVNKL